MNLGRERPVLFLGEIFCKFKTKSKIKSYKTYVIRKTCIKSFIKLLPKKVIQTKWVFHYSNSVSKLQSACLIWPDVYFYIGYRLKLFLHF